MYKQMKQTLQSEYKNRARPIQITHNKVECRAYRHTDRQAYERGKGKGAWLQGKGRGPCMVRVIVHGGSRKRKHAGGGRKPSKSGRYFHFSQIISRAIAEERASRKFLNCEALNSYFVGSAGSKSVLRGHIA